MKHRLSLLILSCAAAGLLATGCEKHAASKTVPGYAEKEAAQKAQQQDQEATALGAESNAPSFFPNKKSE